MTRFAIDALTAIELARRGIDGSGEHKLVAPSPLRSQVLSMLYGRARSGELSAAEAKHLLDGVTTMNIRLLGDRVSRGTAWKLAERLGLDDTPLAEYLAVAQLQADVIVALDPALAELADGIIEVASIDAIG